MYSATRAAAIDPKTAADDLLKKPKPEAHLFCPGGVESGSLSAGQFIAEGLKGGDSVLLLIGGSRRPSCSRRTRMLGGRMSEAHRAGTLTYIDTDKAMARLLSEEGPRWESFDRIAGPVLQELRSRAPSGHVRVYSDIAGTMWKAGHTAFAVRIEEFWSRLMALIGFSLFCEYPIDVFGGDFQIPALDDLLCAHTHLVPLSRNGDLERAVERAMNEVLGTGADKIRPLIKPNFRPAWAAVPPGEATILWIRHNLREEADEIIARARKHYRRG